MTLKDTLKVLILLGVALFVVAVYCYARVDLGMSLEQINSRLEHGIGTVSTFALLIWSQIIVAAVAGLAYRIWRHRSEVRQMRPDTN